MRGFSLVELSIVLVILGLLVGGILAGRSLIRASEIRQITTQQRQFVTAAQAFKDKYFAVPGDFNQATQFWGRVGGGNGNCSNDLTDSDTGLPTCNGSGNGRISGSEMFRFWEHLATAGLIEGSFTGVAGPLGPSHHTPGSNCPAATVGGGWTAVDRDITMTSQFFVIPYGNILQVGTATGSGTLFEGIIRPEEAWNIDTKMDDGRPAYGKVIASRHGNCTDSADNIDLDSNYHLTHATALCALFFRRYF